jgi:hypothetical protein
MASSNLQGYRYRSTHEMPEPSSLFKAWRMSHNVSRVCDAAPSLTEARGRCGGAARRSAAEPEAPSEAPMHIRAVMRRGARACQVNALHFVTVGSITKSSYWERHQPHYHMKAPHFYNNHNRCGSSGDGADKPGIHAAFYARASSNLQSLKHRTPREILNLISFSSWRNVA